MAVVRLEIKTRQPLADGRKFDDVGCYEQLDGTAHFAVDAAHRLNCAVTDIDLAERGRDGLVHFTADVRILAPAYQARGNHRLLFDVPNRGNRLALATFNGVPRPINPARPTDAGNGFLMRHGYTVGLVRLAARRAGSRRADAHQGPRGADRWSPGLRTAAGRFSAEQAEPRPAAVRPRPPPLSKRRSGQPERCASGAPRRGSAATNYPPRKLVIRPAGGGAHRPRSEPHLSHHRLRARQEL